MNGSIISSINQINQIKNPHLKCYHRDKVILSEIEKFKVLDTEQIQKLCFPGIKSGDRIARAALQRLRDKKKYIYSNRIAINHPAYHFIDRKYKNHPQIEHMLTTNWAYIWLTARHSDLTPYFFQHEYTYPTLRADGLLGFRNPGVKMSIFYFIEADLSHNEFDKVLKYNTLFENKNEWQGDWWAKEASGFPAIFVATYRKKHVLERIESENKHNLVFRVHDIEQIR